MAILHGTPGVFELRKIWTLVGAVLGLAFTACSSDSGSDDGSGGRGASASGGVSGRGTAGAASGDGTLGAFSIGLVRPRNAGSQGHTQLIGTVYKAPYPYAVLWEPEREEGDCRLLVPSTPFCDPACDSGDVCVSRNRCLSYPEIANLGAVTVNGMRTASGDTQFTLSPLQGVYQPGSGTGTLPYPAFEPGASIRIETAGGDLPAFSLNGRGIAPLEVLTASPVRVSKDAPVELSWTPSPAAGRITVKLDVSHHGGAKGLLECSTADDGSLSVPASLVTELLGLGVAGFPSIVLSRLETSEASLAVGKVNLIIESAHESAVEIPGLVSCTKAEDCSAGQTCTDARKCE